ncbi:MAG TPA: ABC transporter substrate-binding protein [Vicinamibacterales bacterium]|nr:ABC transporter substrate-binding protein [Vicinamibacterales bacterium]
MSRKIEPRLAREWTSSPDGLTWIFKLQDGVTFSDGVPLTSADVVFTFRALFDPKLESALGSSLLIGGHPIQARALDAQTVSVIFPAAYAPGITLLDAVPILPEHKLRGALEAGTFRDAWSVTTPLNEIVGLGPFVIEEYIAGQRLVFARNPRFWRRDADGHTLPYLDRIELQFTPDQNTESLRLQAGQADLITDRVRFEDLAAFQDLERRKQITLHDAGVSVAPDMLWINLRPGAAAERPWLQREELRHAIAQAVNRATIVNTVFLGQAEEVAGPITSGHGEWFLPDLKAEAFDPAQAASLLASIGLKDRNGDGVLDDANGRTAAFTILTTKGNSVRERTAAVIQAQLGNVGLKVDVVPFDPGALIDQFNGGTYDAILFSVEYDSFDPARNPDFWLSSGPFHVWHIQQPKPATTWEASIDDLMRRQSSTIDSNQRHELFAEAQRQLARHAPVLCFAAPHVVIATSARVGGVTASVLNPPVLWNAESLYLMAGSSGAGR